MHGRASLYVSRIRHLLYGRPRYPQCQRFREGSLELSYISEQLLDNQVMLLIKHTGCTMPTFSVEDTTWVVQKNVGAEAAKKLEGLDFLPLLQLEKAIRAENGFFEEQRCDSWESRYQRVGLQGRDRQGKISHMTFQLLSLRCRNLRSFQAFCIILPLQVLGSATPSQSFYISLGAYMQPIPPIINFTYDIPFRRQFWRPSLFHHTIYTP